MRIRIARVVDGVEPKRAAAWWSDFRDGPDDHGFIPGHRRRIVSRDADSVVMEEETKLLGVPVFRERTTAWPDAREVRFAGKNTYALFDGTYSFEDDPRGTRIALDATVTLGPGLQWADVVAKPVVTAILAADLAGHAKELRRDLMGARQ